MALGVAGGGDTEMEVLPGELDKAGGVVESAGDGDETIRAGRGVAPEGDDVPNAGGFEPGEEGAKLVFRFADAGEVGHGWYVSCLVDAQDHLLGKGLAAAAGAVGHGDEVGTEGGEPVDSAPNGGEGVGGLGRVELEGEGALVLEDIYYFTGQRNAPDKGMARYRAGTILSFCGVGGWRGLSDPVAGNRGSLPLSGGVGQVERLRLVAGAIRYGDGNG